MIKTLNICGFKFKVEYKESVVEDGNSCLGSCHSDDNKLLIKSGITCQRENEVVLHESLHAISDIMALDLTENHVNSLGVLLTEFIAKNKKFINKILKEN